MVDALSTLTGLATGGVLVLGDLLFLDFALPERVTFGGAQQMTVHKLPGGNRVFDTLGPDSSAVSWSGIFLGPASEIYRRQLETMRDAGQPVDLVVGFQSWLVMIRDVQFEQGHMRVDYRISCEVVPDPGPEEEDDASGALGDGSKPDTPQSAQDQGQAKVKAARKIAAKAPYVGAGTSAAPLAAL